MYYVDAIVGHRCNKVCKRLTIVITIVLRSYTIVDPRLVHVLASL